MAQTRTVTPSYFQLSRNRASTIYLFSQQRMSQEALVFMNDVFRCLKSRSIVLVWLCRRLKFKKCEKSLEAERI